MSGHSLPYQLRPNKAVDRELFLSLLMRLTPQLGLERYHYVGLGGPFLEDFRLLHSRIGIGRKRAGRTVGRLTCVESKPEIHKRQRFNRPVASIKCVHSTIEKFLDTTTFSAPAIIWFDYTKAAVAQVHRFAATVGTVPIGSILRVTLNADPVEGREAEPAASIEVRTELRLQRFRERLGSLVPSGLTADSMTMERYGPTLLQVLKLAVEKRILSFTDRRVVWALATHYADGRPMVTAALVVCACDDKNIEKLVKGWEFYSTPDAPHRIELPALSSLERLTMECTSNARQRLGFDLAKVVDSQLGLDPFEVFKKFYRLYPHFSRVEL
jgi:hypothetical protein